MDVEGREKDADLTPRAWRRYSGLGLAGHHDLPIRGRHDVVDGQDRGSVRVAEEKQEKRHEDQRDDGPQAVAEQHEGRGDQYCHADKGIARRVDSHTPDYCTALRWGRSWQGQRRRS